MLNSFSYRSHAATARSPLEGAGVLLPSHFTLDGTVRTSEVRTLTSTLSCDFVWLWNIFLLHLSFESSS